MTLYLTNFYRTEGAKDKKPRRNWKKYIPAIAQAGVGIGLIGTGVAIKKSNAFLQNRAKQTNQFINKMVAKNGINVATRGELYNDFIALPKTSKKMFLSAQEQAEAVGRIPKGTSSKIKGQLRKAHLENIGLSEDLNKIRAAKLQSTVGDIAGQEELGKAVVARARNRAKNKGKTFKGIRQDMRNTLGFSQTTQILATFSRTPGAKDKQKRRSYLGVIGRDAKVGAKIGAGIGAISGLGTLGAILTSKAGRQEIAERLAKSPIKNKLASRALLGSGMGAAVGVSSLGGAIRGGVLGAGVGTVRAPFRKKEVEVVPVDNSIRGRTSRASSALRSRFNRSGANQL
jgi:hypothetical protein